MSETASVAATSVTTTSLIDNAVFQQRFIRKAGIAYGSVFALGFTAFFWLPDALALQQASAHLAWAKLLLGLGTCLPLSMLIGWLAAGTRWSGISILLWIAGCITTAWVAGHIPYEGLSWLASLSDLYPAGRSLHPMSLPAIGFTGISMAIGAVAGLFIGALSLSATGQAWNHSTSKHGFSMKSILALCTCLPFVLVFALMADYQINSSLRESITSLAQHIEQTPGLETSGFTLEWVNNSADIDNNTFDVQFNQGSLVRCRIAYGAMSPCAQIGQDVNAWMTQLMTVGHLTCVGCSAQADRSTRRWLAAVLPSLGNLRDVKLLQHQGGWLYERATFDSGRQIDCRFSGSSPVLIDLCLESKP